MAPTWPSIIPDGAITSAPASACAMAIDGVALERGVVVDVAGAGDDAAVAVVGVLVEAVVGHEHEGVADLVSQVAQGHLHHAVGGVGARPVRVLAGGDAEQHHGGHAEIGQRPHLLAQALLGVLHHARHRHDRLSRFDAFLHEQWRDEVVDRRTGPRPRDDAAPACDATVACAAEESSSRHRTPTPPHQLHPPIPSTTTNRREQTPLPGLLTQV